MIRLMTTSAGGGAGGVGVSPMPPSPHPDEPESPPPPAAEDEGPGVDDPDALLKSHEKYRHENRTLRKRNKDLEEQLEVTRVASMSEQDKAVDEAYQRGISETTEKYHGKLLAQSILAAATGRLADPTDAVKLLDLDGLDPDKPDGIEAAISDLLKAKPHLSAASRDGRGRIDQGPQGGRTPAPEQTGDDWLRSIARSR